MGGVGPVDGERRAKKSPPPITRRATGTRSKATGGPFAAGGGVAATGIAVAWGTTPVGPTGIGVPAVTTGPEAQPAATAGPVASPVLSYAGPEEANAPEGAKPAETCTTPVVPDPSVPTGPLACMVR